MKRMVISLPILLFACGGGDSGPSAELRVLSQCVVLGIGDVESILADVVGLLTTLGGTLPPDATYDGATGDFSITTALGTISGSISTDDDVSDGLDPGESASATWNLGSLAGAAVTGFGEFDITLTSAILSSVTGNATIYEDGCHVFVRPINVTLDLSFGFEPVDGSFPFVAGTSEDTLVGSMGFDGPNDTWVSADFAGARGSYGYYVLFTIDPDTSELHFLQW